MSLGPIPFTAIVEYARLYGIEEFEEFLYFIRLMDNAYLKAENSKQKAKVGDSGKGTASKNNTSKGRHKGSPRA